MKSQNRLSSGSIASRLSLAARLYSIFALFALLTAAITVLSDYNTRRDAELTEAIETADPRGAQRRARQLAGLCGRDGIPRRLHVDGTRRREEIRRRTAQVQRPDPGRRQEMGIHRPAPTTPNSSPPSRSASSSSSNSARNWFAARIEISPAAGREWGDNDANRAVRSALNKDLEALSKVYAERGKQISAADRDQPPAVASC